MFESYTEKARKTIFMGRYQASQFGSQAIEIEHIFLGLLNADQPLAIRVFRSPEKLNAVRERITQEIPRSGETVATSVDLPLSGHCIRVLSHAVAEAENLKHHYISPEHLLLGIMRESTSLTARIILESGITISQLEEEAKQANTSSPMALKPALIEGLRNLVAETGPDATERLVGRTHELDQIIRILSRRNRNNPVLIGEPGAGKSSLVRGLAQRIAEGDVPPDLLDRQILQLDASELARTFSTTSDVSLLVAKAYLQKKLLEISQVGGPILYVRGLFEFREGMPLLADYLKRGKLQIIATGSPLSFRLALERGDELARSFELVSVLPRAEEEALQIVTEAKETFEKFHGVVFSPEAIQTAISASGRFLRNRALPDRALDLIDEAGARVKVRRESLPPEVAALKRQLRMLVRQLEHEIANHSFEQAKKLSEEEKEARIKLDRLREELPPGHPGNTVTPDDILEVIASRTSLTLDAVKAALERPQAPGKEDEIRNELSARIPVGRRDWVEGLWAYLTDCSSEEAEQLREAIRIAKAKLDQFR
jgi:ATP-dependent Clp protease ATP-binding subunit ClpC